MPTKKQVIDKLREQNWILTEAQKPKFRDFLKDYTVEPEDLPYLRKIALANNYDIEKIKDSALFEKIKADVNTRVEDAAAVLDREDVVELKKDRFARLNSFLPRTFNRPGGTIEVTKLEKTPRGVAIYARAWRKNGVQIGFGPDGSVDIERFVFNNPRVLIKDINGDIERHYVDLDGTPRVKKYREDIQAALLIQLEKTIRKIAKFGDENIVSGKVGNTTTTEYPNSGSGTAPIDGRMGRDNVSETFTTLRNGAGTAVNLSGNIGVVRVFADGVTNRYDDIYRTGYGFDTSAIGSDTISSATFTTTGRSEAVAATTGLGDTDVEVVAFTPASGSSFVASDYGNFGTTKFATGIALSTITDGSDQDFSLNASGIAHINGSGDTFFGQRLKWDVDDNFTGSFTINQNSSYFPDTADAVGTTDDPTLVIEHSAGGGGGYRFVPQLTPFAGL